MDKETALIVGPNNGSFPACAVNLERRRFSYRVAVNKDGLGDMDRLVLLHGWEGDEDARRLVGQAIAQQIPLYEFIHPHTMWAVSASDAWERMKLVELDPEPEPDWDFADDLPTGYLAVALLAVS